MNVNNNVIIAATSKMLDIPKQPNKKEEFKRVLDNHELRSNNSSSENVDKRYNSDENLNATNKENQRDYVKNTSAEGSTTKDLNNSVENGIEQSTKIDSEIPPRNQMQSSVEFGMEIGFRFASQISPNSQMQSSNTGSQDDKSLGNTSFKENILNNLLAQGKDEMKISKIEIINLIESAIDALKQNTEELSTELVGTDKSTEEMSQILQLLHFLSSMFQSIDETSITKNEEFELDSVNLGQAIDVEKLSPNTKSILKNNLTEIVVLLEKSKVNSKIPSQIIDVLQKLTAVVEDAKEDLSLLKVPSFQAVNGNSEEKSIKDNLLKKVIEQSTNTASEILPKNQMQDSNDAGGNNKFSGNSSFEENFLKNLLGEDKDEMKISKVVNFMNQFEVEKTLDTSKVQTPNLVIDKNAIEVDVIKAIKFMEVNNVKDLTVKMNPKELGEITIKLTMESGIMKASISAQNKETYNLLNHNIQDISDKLKSMDIKIQSLDINIYEDSTFFSKNSNDENSNGRQNSKSRTNINLDEDEDLSISNNYAVEENQVNKFV